MAHLNLTSPRLMLRSVQPADATSAYVSWLNDPEVVSHTQSEFNQNFRAAPCSARFAIRQWNSGAYIVNIKLRAIDSRHLRAEIGLIIGEKTCWGKAGFELDGIRRADCCCEDRWEDVLLLAKWNPAINPPP